MCCIQIPLYLIGCFSPFHFACLLLTLFFFSQRFVVIATGDTIDTVIVEENAGELTSTEAPKVPALL